MNQNLSLATSVRGSLILWAITFLIFFIFLIILVKRISDSIRIETKNTGEINQYLAAVPADRIGTINAIYQNSQKKLGTALLLALLGGTFGLHRIYLGKRKSAIFMFLFFWTGIPAIISLFDLTAMPRTTSEFNLHVVRSLYDQIAAPKIENN